MPAASDVVFSPTVKAIQEERGSREHFARQEAKNGWRKKITPEVAAFLGAARTAYLASASADGQPYVQHRGGPPGFIRIIDEATLGFGDFSGNRQYITTGNLRDNAKAFLFVMDYEARRRLKLWGTARTIAADDPLTNQLFPHGYEARVEQAIVFHVAAWDVNCPQHIPQLFAAEDVAGTIRQFQARIRELEARVAELSSRD